MELISVATFIVFIQTTSCCLSNRNIHGSDRPNVLFIVSDDMRPQLNSYGRDSPSKVSPKMHTPGLDRLAKRSFLAGRAYVQYAMCGPSRTSLLTGRRPDTTHVYDNLHYFRHVGGNFTTLPQYFKDNGYLSIGMGKIFHPGEASSGMDDPPSWSVPYWHAPNEPYWWLNKTRSWMPVGAETRRKHPLPDEQIYKRAAQMLKELAPKARTGQQPFFMAVGFLKPHLPFIFPQEFLDFYPKETIQLPDNGYAPVNLPRVAWNPYYELRTYKDIQRLHVSGEMNTSLPEAVILNLRRAYYSALSYTDSLIGLLLDQLEQLGLTENTIISFIGDHGWQLGEHGEWCKQTNFELSTHAPLLVSVPGLTATPHHSEQLIEFVDLLPTLVDLAGLPPVPTCPKNSQNVSLCTEGRSFAPLIHAAYGLNTGKSNQKLPKTPFMNYTEIAKSGDFLLTTPVWKSKAFSQFRREIGGVAVMGYTMRTALYRYTEWVRFTGKPIFKPKWSQRYGVELYDHQIDPEENRNLAHDGAYQRVVVKLSQELHKGWQGAL